MIGFVRYVANAAPSASLYIILELNIPLLLVFALTLYSAEWMRYKLLHPTSCSKHILLDAVHKQVQPTLPALNYSAYWKMRVATFPGSALFSGHIGQIMPASKEEYELRGCC